MINCMNRLSARWCCVGICGCSRRMIVIGFMMFIIYDGGHCSIIIPTIVATIIITIDQNQPTTSV